MSLEQFISKAISPWMKQSGPEDDIVLSSRIRLARNLEDYPFPFKSSNDAAQALYKHLHARLANKELDGVGHLSWFSMKDSSDIEKQVLVEKHLTSPQLAEGSSEAAVVLSEDESISIMVNEEDHLRIQCLSPGLQLTQAYEMGNAIDDWIEANVDYAFDEKRGYLTSCPTNVGTGLRASVMMHLPGLVTTSQLSRIIPAVNQIGLVVRGIYGEGSEARGNLFQISNQMTLGKTETDIIDDLRSVVLQLIERERLAREKLYESKKLQLADQVYRSYGILANSRIIESKEAGQHLSNLRLGIDLNLIQGVDSSVLNDLMILIQPAFLQQYAQKALSTEQRDERRASLIRERLKLENI
ncbi:putative ATP:guanido phosphotransferase YacI [Geomicrobium sp. JCM 19037]|uniref:protein arginine kinase n=1 Tax=unclassified Geomicrobium TaxID=2628951 RepID=UPI00045F2629|nr:protein arginine kinase [Geomicrobium sp. JCM 19037]GAK04699.1 putative ATP:guanido phosphotransferase YacI [Geomicrobium sp. JCM 19037]